MVSAMDVVRRTIGCFAEDISRTLGLNLCEIIIRGSYAPGDFTPHRGNLDYTILTRRDLDDADLEALFSLHD